MWHNIGKICEIAKNAAKVYRCISPIIKLVGSYMRKSQHGCTRSSVMFASVRIYLLHFILGRYGTRYFSWGAEECIRQIKK